MIVDLLTLSSQSDRRGPTTFCSRRKGDCGKRSENTGNRSYSDRFRRSQKKQPKKKAELRVEFPQFFGRQYRDATQKERRIGTSVLD
jgi:hypothetical protein